MAILSLEKVSLRFNGPPILDNLSVDFRKKCVHAIIGPNGAGKSTLAAAIMGLEGYRAIEGRILLDGEEINDWPVDRRARAGITMAWQEPARFEGLTVSDFLASGTDDVAGECLAGTLESVGLEPSRYLERAVDKTLSGGERKRIELASILVMRPRLVLMDEPDSGIDVEALERIFEAIQALQGRGVTVVLITHSMAVLKQAEHAFLMCDGRILEQGSIEEVGRYFEGRCRQCRTHDPRLEEGREG